MSIQAETAGIADPPRNSARNEGRTSRNVPGDPVSSFSSSRSAGTADPLSLPAGGSPVLTAGRDPENLLNHAAKLRFPDREVEKAFREDYAKNSLPIARVAIVLTIVLYGLFGLLDTHAAPLCKQAIWQIRFVVVIPVFVGALLFSYHDRFLQAMQSAMVLVALTAGFGILAMIVIVSRTEIGYHSYYAGLMLVIMGAHGLLRLRFYHATLSTLVLVAGYEAVAIFSQKLLHSRQEMVFFITNNFFFISSNIIGMMASYWLEVYNRRDFVQRFVLAEEQKKSERLLLNILPEEIASALKDRDRVIADRFDAVSILFADVVDFTPISSALTPEEIVGHLNEVFTRMDVLMEHHGLEKIKTIGDCYMAAAGVPRPRGDHAHVLVQVGLDILNYFEGRPFAGGRKLSLRIGINSGPVVAGVIGRNKFIYDLWGDAVNMASRMESHGAGGKIQITRSTYELIKNEFVCEPCGTISVKGIGETPVWHVRCGKMAVPAGV